MKLKLNLPLQGKAAPLFLVPSTAGIENRLLLSFKAESLFRISRLLHSDLLNLSCLA